MKDLNVMEFADDIDAESPMGLLRGIKFGTETYHVLFMRLCRLVCVLWTRPGHRERVGGGMVRAGVLRVDGGRGGRGSCG